MRSSRHQQGAAGYFVKFQIAFDLPSTLFETPEERLTRGAIDIIAMACFRIQLLAGLVARLRVCWCNRVGARSGAGNRRNSLASLATASKIRVRAEKC